MLEYVTQSLPILVPLIMYFVRLEIALAKLQTDMTWIKKALPGCATGCEPAGQKGE